eukprot:CAMPEP_0197651924 /NCGR_PEP_ID=MMETSP1338-20131121/34138_1 /TAXON_ID=43686 ORGANISM="Pelagodinium beii, Strain RCC1491" /NCGR_SAMPLE_ID=MMETSP1338 /ASSEMBLY_ACC=CAM_ASM_000754 /LENGTH=141 /DNA_ID=CAMNT_0043226691 /DNA_START=60 /DNA_END=481 /DNA_ORIENTATION=-
MTRSKALPVIAGAAATLGSLAFVAPSAPSSGHAPQLRGASAAIESAASQGSASTVLGSAALCAVAGFASSRRRGKVQRKAEDDAYGASHTSFYTDAVAKDKYDTLEEVLAAKLKDGKLKAHVNELLDACVKITEALRVNLV